MNEYMNEYKDYANEYCMENEPPMYPMYPQTPGWGGMCPPGMMEPMPYPPMMGPTPYPGMGMMPHPCPPMDMMPEMPDKNQLCYLEQMHRYMAHMCEAEACRCKAMQHMMHEQKY